MKKGEDGDVREEGFSVAEVKRITYSTHIYVCIH